MNPRMAGKRKSGIDVGNPETEIASARANSWEAFNEKKTGRGLAGARPETNTRQNQAAFGAGFFQVRFGALTIRPFLIALAATRT